MSTEQEQPEALRMAPRLQGSGDVRAVFPQGRWQVVQRDIFLRKASRRVRARAGEGPCAGDPSMTIRAIDLFAGGKNGDRLCIDLCSGLGGFSAAFRDAGWEVVTVDIDPRFEPTVCADITKAGLYGEIANATKTTDLRERFSKIIVLASPPCERFSLACHTWPKTGIQRALQIVGACLETISLVKPDSWLLENPKGRLRWFLGTPRGTIRLSDYGAPYLKPTDYWGNVALPMLDETIPARIYLRPMRHDIKSASPIYLSGSDKAGRAKMPYGLSQAILEAVS